MTMRQSAANETEGAFQFDPVASSHRLRQSFTLEFDQLHENQ